MTYELDGHQFVLTPVGGWLYAWALPQTRHEALNGVLQREEQRSEGMHGCEPSRKRRRDSVRAERLGPHRATTEK